MRGANIRCQPFPMEKKAVIVNDAFYGREEMPSSHELWPWPVFYLPEEEGVGP